MPPKMVTCALCGQEVSKRKSLSLKALGLGEGRACREHPQVQELVQALEEKREIQWQEDETNRAMAETMRKLRVMSCVSLIRVGYSIRGVDPETLYARFRLVGYPPDMIDEIRDEVDRQGGPQMSEDEIFGAVVGAMDLKKRGIA